MNCNNVYLRIDATKALCHVLMIKGTQHVAACKVEITMMYLKCYQDLYARRYHGKEAKVEEVVARSQKTLAWQDKIV